MSLDRGTCTQRTNDPAAVLAGPCEKLAGGAVGPSVPGVALEVSNPANNLWQDDDNSLVRENDGAFIEL